MISRRQFVCPSVDCFVKTIQNGDGMDYYQGKATPLVGYGAFSLFFGKMMRFVIPLLRRFVVPAASDVVDNTITDFDKGQDFGSSLKKNIRNKVRDIMESVKQRGSGISRPCKRKLISLQRSKVKARPIQKIERSKADFFWRKISFLPSEDSVPSVSSAFSYFPSPNVMYLSSLYILIHSTQ